MPPAAYAMPRILQVRCATNARNPLEFCLSFAACCYLRRTSAQNDGCPDGCGPLKPKSRNSLTMDERRIREALL